MNQMVLLLWLACGGSLSLMCAGAPLKSHVAGIAMGLINYGARNAILSDILGLEDHLGDMDFKVVGTRGWYFCNSVRFKN